MDIEDALSWGAILLAMMVGMHDDNLMDLARSRNEDTFGIRGVNEYPLTLVSYSWSWSCCSVVLVFDFEAMKRVAIMRFETQKRMVGVNQAHMEATSMDS